jgi:hypothetical protein
MRQLCLKLQHSATMLCNGGARNNFFQALNVSHRTYLAAAINLVGMQRSSGRPLIVASRSIAFWWENQTG